MATAASTTAGLVIPVPAGAANSAIADPLTDGLAAYCGHWIKYALDAKFAVIGGPSTTAITDACPTANRFSYDPKGWWTIAVENAQTPCLWVWSISDQRERQTMVYDMITRKLGFLYAFPQVLGPRGMPTRSGMMNAVAKALRVAFMRGAHPTYAGGVQFVDTIADPNTLEVFLDSTEEGFEFAAPQTGAGAGGEPDGGFEQYGYPVLRGVFTARERVGHDTFEDPGDLLGDMSMTITHNEYGDVLDGLTVLEGTLPGPDGSEDGDEVI